MSRGDKLLPVWIEAEHAAAANPDTQQILAAMRRRAHIDFMSTENLPLVPTFIPGPLSSAFNHPYASGGSRWSRLYYYIYSRISSRIATIWTLREMAKYRSWPPMHPPLSTRTAVMDGLFLGSTSEKRWLADVRRAVLQVYTKLGEAVAMGDRNAIRKLAGGEYAKTSLGRVPGQGVKYAWRIDRQVKPVKCLSWRAIPYDVEHQEMPEPGAEVNGFLIQAVFRFDTIQSLQPTTLRGPANPVPPTHVVEYLILEKRNWLPLEGWKIVGQTKPGVWIGSEVAMKQIWPDRPQKKEKEKA
ncbi:hypothetical protein EXIGLDRAFT_734337 [Exidia glandulosa HHB12029]|uniref:Tim44-like domain-containing protein n=1 Tax=Exidia glandulosa HHB12029 TaxID=1314781 RepID=A0A165K5Z4_EXIGL|nr:hypothetical protein EXIGLDRAFT_734337 [Exidia glandulosa HHB12029]